MEIIGNGWDEILNDEFERPYFKRLRTAVEEEYEKYTVFPPHDLVYAALKTVDYSDVKVCILGQDPYHGFGQANGMAFAVGKGIELPPSLKNIFTELESDLGVTLQGDNGTLIGWAKQGVLLLNTVLTVRSGQPQSHAALGWQTFTDVIIRALAGREKPLAFVLWGSNAIRKKEFISGNHLVITSPHPSPLSAYRGFFGSKPFSRVNEFLTENGQTPIDWTDISGAEYASYYSAKGTITRV